MAFRPNFAPAFGFHQPPQIFFNPMLGRQFNHHMQQPQHQAPPARTTPVTTVFVGNISDKCTNEFMQQMLQECGVVSSWKRIQGSNGKYQAFGFCDYELPEGTLRSLRVLNDFQIGDKKLVVKAEDKVRDDLRSWAIDQRREEGKPELKLKDNELPADEEDMKKDEEVRLKILNWIETDHPQLLTLAEDGELSDKEAKEKKDARRKDKTDDSRVKSTSDRRRGRSRSGSRSRVERDRHRGRSRSLKHKRRHRRSSSHSSHSSSSSGSSHSSDSSRSRSRSVSPRNKKKRKDRSDSRNRDSEDSEDARERKLLKKQIKEKEAAYTQRLRKWEKREKEMAKKYEREERRDKDRKKNILKEAKKLKNFLEDYDDEKDDPKYYKSSSLFQRKREFEREREADQKDRLREQMEIEELKKLILSENKDTEDAENEARKRHHEQEEAALKRLRADSGSPNPHQPLGQREGDADSSSSSGESDNEEGAGKAVKMEVDTPDQGLLTASTENGNGLTPNPSSATSVSLTPVQQDRWKSVGDQHGVGSPSVLQSTGDRRESSVSSPLPLTRQPPKRDLNQRLNGVFGLDEDDEGLARKRLRPFEITKEERMESLTEEEKKRMVKDLIARIPTAKEDLFAFKLDWNFVDKQILDGRLRPWVSKKINEYLGEEETALVDFICGKVESRSSPDDILPDVRMILDDDAEVFVMKMWRLLVYESEAKKLGLPKNK